MPNKQQPNTKQTAQLLASSNQCVMCALCLPHCPSYRITRNEADSPRGRIAIMRAILQHDIPLTTAALQHLDQCTSCLNCESMCPSRVPFGELISGTRNQIQHSSTPRWHALLARLLSQPRLLHTALSLLTITPGWIRRKINPVGDRLGQHLRGVTKTRLKPHYPAVRQKTGQIQLFIGCLREIDADNIHAAIRLLNHMGYDVNIPVRQGCCGSFHHHHGYQHKARQLSRRNNAAISNEDGLILSINSACSTQLQHDNEQTHASMDILSFILLRSLDDISFSSCDKRIAIHLPCSARNGLGHSHELYSLLQQIPGIELIELAQEATCCGAGGSHFITQPDMAEQMRQPLIQQLHKINPDILISANISCALHIKNGILDAGLDIEVMHPVTLLARQLL